MIEIFKTIPGFKNYQVSNLGNIKSLKTNKILKPEHVHNGYRRVNFYKKINSKIKKIHKKIGYLVLLTFVGDRPKDMTISHLDGNNQNDKLNNLIYESLSDNLKRRGCEYFIGEKNPAAKLKNNDIIKIKKMLKDGIKQKIIASFFEVSLLTISLINRHKTWRHISI